jgi:hypothetical protein
MRTSLTNHDDENRDDENIINNHDDESVFNNHDGENVRCRSSVRHNEIDITDAVTDDMRRFCPVMARPAIVMFRSITESRFRCAMVGFFIRIRAARPPR